MSQQEEDFIKYWEDQRLRKKQFLRKFSIGLPFATLIAAAILVNLVSGWYKKAEMAVRSEGSVVIVVLIGLLSIVVFITIFSAHHRWDQNELHYHELLRKKQNEDGKLA